jgi:hypothetical protein
MVLDSPFALIEGQPAIYFRPLRVAREHISALIDFFQEVGTVIEAKAVPQIGTAQASGQSLTPVYRKDQYDAGNGESQG